MVEASMNIKTRETGVRVNGRMVWPGRLMGVLEVAAILEVSEGYVRELCEGKQLMSRRNGKQGHIKIPGHSVLQFVGLEVPAPGYVSQMVGPSSPDLEAHPPSADLHGSGQMPGPGGRDWPRATDK